MSYSYHSRPSRSHPSHSHPQRSPYYGRHRHRRRRRSLLHRGGWGWLVIFGIVLLAVPVLIFSGGSDRREKDPGKKDPGKKDPVPVVDPVTPVVSPDGKDTEGEKIVAPSNVYATIPVSGDTQSYAAVYRVGNTAYEYYNYSASCAEGYANAVGTLASNLKGVSTVYTIPNPTSTGITLPDELMGTINSEDQKSALEKVTALMSSDVKVVPLYDILMQHRTEYIYFRTDHHWTARGAYYAYRSFCDVKGIVPHELEDYREAVYPDFLGSFYADTDKNEQLANMPDEVHAYIPIAQDHGMTHMHITQSSGPEFDWVVVNDVSSYPTGVKYSAFIGGDYPYTIIANDEITDGSSCIVVKESFGCAFVPFLVDHYHTIHVIDYRYWNGSLTEFAKTNHVQDVIFCNNLSAIRSQSKMGALQRII